MKEPYIFDFIRLLHQLQAIQRDVGVPEHRPESDVKHSYQLAMVAWYINERNQLALDNQRIFQYALAHDLVEIYAGDVNPLTASAKTMSQKASKEHAASLRLRRELPDFPALHQAITAYEQKADAESRFVYVVDKVTPVMNLYIFNSDWYNQRDIPHDQWLAWLSDKLARVDYQHFDDAGFMDELLAFLKIEAAQLFANGSTSGKKPNTL